MSVGILDLSFATGKNVLDLALLAEAFGVDPEKYRTGIGQDEMTVLADDEDIVTLGAAAAKKVLNRHGSDGIRTLLFATESGIDQSKSAGVYVHGLLELPRAIRVLELKQACYSGAGALQLALGIVARNPTERVLVIAADNARYELGTSGEPTQGAGAVAMLVGAGEQLLVEIEAASGIATDDIHDFWRPNDHSTALVDGKYSMRAYIDAARGALSDYREHGGVEFESIDYFCYHQPFTRMAEKAHKALSRDQGVDFQHEQIIDSTIYNRRIGNTYAASVFLGLLSLLDSDKDLAGKRVGFLSYGSGAVAEFFTGIVQPGYRELLRVESNLAELAGRRSIDLVEYRALHAKAGSYADRTTERSGGAGGFRFTGIDEHIRQYSAD